MAKNVQETQAQETAVTTIDTPEGQILVPDTSTVAGLFMSGAANFMSTIKDDGTPQYKALLYAALNSNDGNVADLAEEKTAIEVRDFVAYPVQVVTEDGEVADAIRCVLITPDGKTYGTVANGVFTALQKLVPVCGMAPWTPALKIQPFRQKTRRGFYMLSLRLMAE